MTVAEFCHKMKTEDEWDEVYVEIRRNTTTEYIGDIRVRDNGETLSVHPKDYSIDTILYADIYKIVRLEHNEGFSLYVEEFSVEEGLPYSHKRGINRDVSIIMKEYKKFLKFVNDFGYDIRLTPNSLHQLELYYHDDYDNVILVDKDELGLDN